MKCDVWNIEEETGYVPKTTFYMDFSIADSYGINAVKDTYRRVFSDWRSDVVYLTELVMVLNWKSWEHHSKGNESLVALYSELYYACREYALDNLSSEELRYFLSVTD